MRLCLNDVTYTGKPYREMTSTDFNLIADIGFRMVSISADTTATAREIDRMRGLMADAGIVAGPTIPSLPLIHPDPQQAAAYSQRITDSLTVLGRVGGFCLQIAGGSLDPGNAWNFHPENHTQRAMDMIVDQTRALLPVIEDTGIMVCPETTQWTIINTPRRMKEYVDRVDSPLVKAVFDISNHMTPERLMRSGAFTRETLALLGDRIGILHVKDTVPVKGLVSHLDEVPPGEGYLDHEEIIRASESLEPWKAFSLEHFRAYQGTPKLDMIRRGYEYITGVAESIGHTWTDPSMTRTKWEQMRESQ